MSRKKMYIIDGSSFLYRAYYGLKPLHSPDGKPIQAVYGFCRMIKKIIYDNDVISIVLVWDVEGKTSRHEIFSEYKAHRQAPPEDIFEQKKLIIEFANIIGLVQVGIKGFEADDIMYTIAREASENNYNVIIVSSDKDMGQIVSDTTVIQYDPVKDIYYDVTALTEKYGFEPKKIPIFFAFLGDSSDNIPGARGIGKKTATELAIRFDSIDQIYHNLDSCNQKTKKLLLASKDDVYLSYQLFQLRTVVSDKIPHNYDFDKTNYKNAEEFFHRLGFQSLLKKDPDNAALSKTIDEKFIYWKEKKYFCITSISDLDALIEKIMAAKVCAIDTETSGQGHSSTVTLVGVSVSYDQSAAFYIPILSPIQGQCLAENIVIEAIRSIFADTTINIIMHNAKYDLLVFSQYNLSLHSSIDDTMIIARLILPEWERVGLKNLSERYFHESMISFSEITEKCNVATFDKVSLEFATIYAAADAQQTYRLFPLVYEKLCADDLLNLYTTIERPIISILVKMEQTGILVNPSILDELGIVVNQKIQEIKIRIANQVGHCSEDINLNSPRQVEQLLFDTLGLPRQKKSAKKTGYSTDVHVLKKLSLSHSVPALLLEYRELTKLQQTYIEGLSKYINPQTGRINTSFNQAVVATGRLSSSEPNMQNIPASGIGLALRKAFVASEESVFVAADYSQIELRIIILFNHFVIIMIYMHKLLLVFFTVLLIW